MYGNFEIDFCYEILSELMPEKYAVDRDDMRNMESRKKSVLRELAISYYKKIDGVTGC